MVPRLTQQMTLVVMVAVAVVVMVFGGLVEGRGVDPRHLHLSSSTNRGNHHFSTTKRNQQQPPVNFHHLSTTKRNQQQPHPHHHSSTTKGSQQQPPINPHSSTTKRSQQQPPINPHHYRQHLPAGTRTQDAVGTAGGSVCKVCPPASELNPCKCTCLNATTAEVVCGPDLTSCSQLTDVLTLTNFPSNLYIRLTVNKTVLECILQEDLWGPVQFQEIHLVANRFHTLDNYAFAPFSTSLTLLNLDDNLLQNVYFPALSQVPSLESLSLADNLISFLPGYFPFTLPRLRSLSLAHNRLTQLQQKSFAELPHLEHLDLSHNLLTTLYPDAFTITDHQTPHLYIDLSHNAISTIEEGVLVGSETCDINLSYNALTTLDEHIFRPLIDTCGLQTRIRVIGNPFSCDNRLCWIAQNKTVSTAFDPIHCPNYNDQPLGILAPLCNFNQRPTVLP